jgi:peptidoglycan/LPS O-acetylase OafA/YrhL
MLSLPALVYTGKISYDWYLWHFPILMSGALYFGHGRWTALALGLCSYPVAAMSYHFIGLPFLRLKTLYFTKVRSNAPTASTLSPLADT